MSKGNGCTIIAPTPRTAVTNTEEITNLLELCSIRESGNNSKHDKAIINSEIKEKYPSLYKPNLTISPQYKPDDANFMIFPMDMTPEPPESPANHIVTDKTKAAAQQQQIPGRAATPKL